jgi:hypothetical protein
MQTQSHAASANGAPRFADILCAIDGKEGGFSSVEHAAALAGTQGDLTFLAVTSHRSSGSYRGPAIGPAVATEILERAGGIAREAGVPYTSEVDTRSPPARVILDWSARYDLLALGAPASSWPAKLLSVGVGDKALGGFTTALLVARPLAGPPVRDCMSSQATGWKLQALIELAAKPPRAQNQRVTLVRARARVADQTRTCARSGTHAQEQTLARSRIGHERAPGRAGSAAIGTVSRQRPTPPRQRAAAGWMVYARWAA